MILLESMETARINIPLKIFGTDISDRGIEKARAAIYSEAITAEVSPQRLQHFFNKTERGYEIRKSVRDLCVFARQDVSKDPPFSQVDLISCRNLLIYLDPVLQGRVLPIFHYAPRPGGFLMLGNSETVGSFTDLFEPADRRYKFYIRTATPSRLTFDYRPGTAVRTRVSTFEGGRERGPGIQEVYREADRVVLGQYAPPGVLVDENLLVIQFRGDTGAFSSRHQVPPLPISS